MSLSRGRRVLAIVLAAAAAALVALYLGLTVSQGNSGAATSQLFATVFAILGLLPAVALAVPARAGAALTGVAAAAWLVLAGLTVASIGIAILPLALLAIGCLGLAVAEAPRARALPALAGAVLGILAPLALVGFEPYLPPSCPSARGNLSGEAVYPGPLYGDVTVTYRCRDGRLLDWQVKKGVSSSGSGSGRP